MWPEPVLKAFCVMRKEKQKQFQGRQKLEEELCFVIIVLFVHFLTGFFYVVQS